MEGPGAEATGPVVQPEGEHTKGSVGAVRAAGVEGGSPEVVPPQVRERRGTQDILVA